MMILLLLLEMRHFDFSLDVSDHLVDDLRLLISAADRNRVWLVGYNVGINLLEVVTLNICLTK